jgi:sulfatase modifying factor 1
MPFCANCGYKVTEQANYCPKCGLSVKPETIPVPPEETIPPVSKAPLFHKKDHTFTLLEIGDLFNKVYRIERVIGKENDGISYLATDERNNKLCSLKLFYQAYFDNVDKLFGAIVRMSKIKAVDHPDIAKVYEVNQTHKPAYMASEHIEGLTLQELKDRNPEQFTEEYVRQISRQLVNAAISIRKGGLAVRNLSLQNIIRSNDGRLIILSSGINYDVREEGEDIFTMGIILAKLFSKSPFYETIYVQKRLLEKKFDYLSGISLGVNELLAECLHRNIAQRFASFKELAIALDKLKPVNQDEIYVSNDNGIASLTDQDKMAMPKKKLDIYFWGILIFIVAFICIVMTTNLLDTIFGNKNATFKFTGFLTGLTDSTEVLSSIANDNYRNLKVDAKSYRRKQSMGTANQNTANNFVNPDVAIPAAPSAFTSNANNQDATFARNQTSVQKKQPIPENLVFIYGDVFAFGSLRKDTRDNASLNGFYISKTEITQAEWSKFMKPVVCSSAGDNLPVDNVSWFDVIMYCNTRSEAEGLTPCYQVMGFAASRMVSCNFKANGYRLPTEAEWEYAARAKKLFSYSGSDAPEQFAWYKDNANERIHTVKSKDPNAFGLYDMTGNVAEWCWDWYDINFPKYMPFINPAGPNSGNVKVIRGGSIESARGGNLEVIYRNKGNPFKSYRYVGFRVVRGK